MNRHGIRAAVFALLVLSAALSGSPPAPAAETEHIDLQVLPAPGPVVADGKTDDWDLTGGIFACGDVENARDAFAVWLHAMHDAQALHVLARWVDPTPMNNPGSSKGDYGFNGDCLQFRVVTAPDVAAREVAQPDRNADDAPRVRTSHLTCWRDRDGLDVIDIAYGRRFSEGGLKDAKAQGAAQAFLQHADGKGYVQEISIPWALLSKPDHAVKAGDRLLMTFEPNFTVGTGGRLTIKDLFKPGVAIDRVFTFQGSGCWGFATLAAQGRVAPRPVRLSSGREFAVRIESGRPAIDWTGVVRSREPDGFKPVTFTMPEDGYVSINLFRPDGSVARQLLACAFYTKGAHTVKWDGLTTMSVRRPGEPVAAGEYTWAGIVHDGIGLRLRGWAANSGAAPWSGWGADHGNPVACAADGERVYCGWGGGEGDKPLLACDTQGRVLWKNIRGGIASAGPVASDGKTVYAWNDIGQYASRALYRVDAKTGRYTEWSELKSTDLTMKDLWGAEPDAPQQPSGLSAAAGRVFVSCGGKDVVLIVDAKTGRVQKRLSVPKPGDLEAAGPDRIFVATEGRAVLSVDVATGESKEVAKARLEEGKDWISALAVDKAGRLYLGIRGASHQVQVFGPDGQWIRDIGRKGGRPPLGPWATDGLLHINGLAIDGQGQLWVAEDDGTPRRVSVWNAETGAFIQEHFGSSSYGAIGAAVNPRDPFLMVGQGCEWRLDPKTGRSACVGVVSRDGMGASRFGTGPGNRLYLAVTPGFLHDASPIRIFERLGDAQYRLRAALRSVEKPGADGKKRRVTEVWSDANDDAQEQPEEVKTYATELGGWFQGWYMSMTPDLTFYGTFYQAKVTGWTACGAPLYDLDQAKRIAGPEDARNRGGMGAQRGHGSVDGKLMLWNAPYGVDHGTVDCYDIASGKCLWTYPSNFTGVHGSHRACAPEVGMLRGAYDIAGAAQLPPPVGGIWVIPTNKGEWHVLTEKGYYLTRLFEGDPMKNAWPEKPVPGAVMDACPPGAGEEAFGGSICQHPDGGLTVQAGHISFWNLEAAGLETIRPLPGGGTVAMTEEDVKTSRGWRERLLQESSGLKQLAVRKATPVFTGALGKDFGDKGAVEYQKMDAARVRTALAWDDARLYAAWEVKDDTPWVNGADAPEFLYARGDTVDLQIGSDPAAKADRDEAVLGDLRLSIGPFQGKPAAVLYRKAAAEKSPKTFNSGVVKGYVMESVTVLKDATVEVKVDAVRRLYTVEASIPLAALGLKPAAGLKIRGDVGATHGNKDGNDTALRTYWSNQSTGLVSDEVFELQMVPKNWGELKFE
jgi:hypothetical protein